MAHFCKTSSGDQANVAGADDGDFHEISSEAKKFYPLRKDSSGMKSFNAQQKGQTTDPHRQLGSPLEISVLVPEQKETRLE